MKLIFSFQTKWRITKFWFSFLIFDFKISNIFWLVVNLIGLKSTFFRGILWKSVQKIIELVLKNKHKAAHFLVKMQVKSLLKIKFSWVFFIFLIGTSTFTKRLQCFFWINKIWLQWNLYEVDTTVWSKTNFKKQKLKYFNSFFDLKSKNKFPKSIWFFNFGFEIEKQKMKNFQNSFLFLNQKTNHTFGTRINGTVWFCFKFHFLNLIWKLMWYQNYNINLSIFNLTAMGQASG